MKQKADIGNILFCIVLAILYVSIFSFSTSPFYSNQRLDDSNYFFLIGRGWLNGQLPYVDFFDNKGPFIYLINAMGFALTGNKYGIYIIQIITNSLTLYLSLRILQQRYSRPISLALTSLIALGLSIMTEGGNAVEEYVLPLIVLSFGYFYRWGHQTKSDTVPTPHPSNWAFVYGITFSLCLTTRLANALGLFAGIAVIACYLIYKRLWKNLFQNAMTFLLGFCVILLPFGFYFGYKGAFADLWENTIVVGFSYLQRNVSRDELNLHNAIYRMLPFIYPFLLLCISWYLWVKEKNGKWCAAIWISAASALVIWYTLGGGYVHYGILTIAFIPIILLELDVIKEHSIRKVELCIARILSILFLIVTLSGGVMRLYGATKGRPVDMALMEKYQAMLSVIPSNEKNDFLAYECDPNIYYYCHLVPANKYFLSQEFTFEILHEQKQQILKDFEQPLVKWLLVEHYPRVSIRELLDRRYQLVKETGGTRLYRCKHSAS